MGTTLTNPLLEAVLADLATEGAALEALVAPITPARWQTPTPAEGWDIATSIAHLAWTDEAVIAATTDKEAWDTMVLAAIADPTGFVDQTAIEGARDSPAALLARWQTSRNGLMQALREFPAGARLPWFGPPMSPTSMATARFMETWAHGLDIAAALGVEPRPTDRIRHVAHLGVLTRDFAFGVHGLEPPAERFHISLTAPSGELWEWGTADAAQSVTGPAYDFCLLVTQRRHRRALSLEAVGTDADRWLDIAQAFAGPPGEGRRG